MINPFRVANEWRDSLGLTTCLALVAAVPCREVVAVAILMIATRELYRDVAWYCHPPMRIVGDQTSLDHRDVSDGGALISSAFFLVYWVILSSFGEPFRLIFLGITMLCTLLHVFRIYILRRSNMTRIRKAWVQAWDWPRKRGGPTETQKLADIAARLGQSLRPAATEA